MSGPSSGRIEVREPVASEAGPTPVTVPLTALEEAIVASERRWPITIHLEARTRRPLDAERLARAVRRAMADHPLARAHLAPSQWFDRVPRWVDIDHLTISGALGDPLAVVTLEPRAVKHASPGEAVDDPRLDDLRERWCSAPIPLDQSPPFRLLLVHEGDRDRLVLAAHHGAFDGGGAVALLVAIGEAYARDDPGTGPIADPGAEWSRRLGLAGAGPDPRRDQHPHPGADPDGGVQGAGRAGRVRHVVGYLRSPRSARLVPGGGRPAAPGYHVVLDRLAPDTTSIGLGAAIARVAPDATRNDVLLAAYHRHLARWNRDHGGDDGLITVTVPVTGRAPHERHEVVANLTLQATTTTNPHDRRSVAELAATIVGQTRTTKMDGAAAEPAMLASALAFLPVAGRARIPEIVSWLTRDRGVDTSRLSNLGRVDTAAFGAQGLAVEHLWFSPPVRPPQGLTLGVLTYDGALHLAYRACRSQWARAEVAAFAAGFRSVLADDV